MNSLTINNLNMQQIDAFIDFIREKTGIAIKKSQHDTLKKAIIAACVKFKISPENYYATLLQCPNDSPLLEYLIAHITVGETYFFRDANQMKLLKEIILPNLIISKRTNKQHSLRIWSAGCATGEEIYTIAIMLDQLLPDRKTWSLQLLGTDINTESLQKAIQGKFSQWSMRSIDKNIINKYFQEKKHDFSLNEDIKNSVKFAYHNLMEKNYPSFFNETNAQDLILCRNVFIYFDQNQINKIMSRFSACLTEGGHLMLGASDPIQLAECDLVFKNLEGTHILQKNQPPTQIKIMQDNEIFCAPIEDLIPKLEKQENIAMTQKVSKPAAIEKLVKQAQWQAAIQAIDRKISGKGESLTLLNLKAKALANLGQCEKSIEICQYCLRLDPANKESYFTLALNLLELNKLHEAKTVLQKAIFLDHNFIEGYYHLGLLLLRLGDKQAGLKNLNNALTSLKNKNPKENVIGATDLNYEQLGKILAREIEIR